MSRMSSASPLYASLDEARAETAQWVANGKRNPEWTSAQIGRIIGRWLDMRRFYLGTTDRQELRNFQDNYAHSLTHGLLGRLFSGRRPLVSPPPTRGGNPWYSLEESGSFAGPMTVEPVGGGWALERGAVLAVEEGLWFVREARKLPQQTRGPVELLVSPKYYRGRTLHIHPNRWWLRGERKGYGHWALEREEEGHGSK